MFILHIWRTCKKGDTGRKRVIKVIIYLVK